MKAYDKLSTYDPKYKFFSWIYRIMTNESLNLIGRRRSHEPLDFDLVSTQKNPEEEYEGRRVGRAVQSALMRLSADHRQVLVLRHFVALSYKEMSSALGLPEKTVKSRLFAARRQLGAILVNRSATT
jgi:RNA polymerase sigma-70 factor (ECF subfamily)